MKKVLILIIFLTHFVAAQTFKSGDRCIMFGINGLFSISQSVSPVGSVLYKKYKTDTRAKRIGVNFTNNETKNVNPDEWVEYSSNTTTQLYKYTNRKNEQTSTSQSFGFSYGNQYRLYAKGKFETFALWDLGVFMEFTINNTSTTYVDSYTPVKRIDNVSRQNVLPGDYSKTESKNYKIGVSPQIGLGFNYYLTDFISFGIELNYAVRYSYTLLESNTAVGKSDGVALAQFPSQSNPSKDYTLTANNFKALITCQFLLKRPEKKDEAIEKQ